MSHEDYYDSDRYDSAAGWDGSSRGAKKWKPKPPRKKPLFVPPKDIEDGRRLQPLRPLFGDLWSERDVAVLAGETGVGKSVLAVQLAELLARGRLSPHVTAKRVLYVDFEHTTNQFEDRYSAPRHAHQKVRRIRYRFAKRFQRVVPGFDQEPEKKFRGNVGRYFCNEIGRAVDVYDADIVIIDNLSFLMMGGRGAAAAERAMLQLRTVTRAFFRPVSILVTACLNDRPKPGPIELRDLAGSRRIAELADTVFALGRSAASEDLRYLKHLKSRKAPLLPEEWNYSSPPGLRRGADPSSAGWSGRRGGGSLDANNVAILQISRISEPPSAAGGLKTNEPGRSSTALSRTTVHRPLSTGLSIQNLQLTLGLPLPFLGLTHIGFSPESTHLRDPSFIIRNSSSHRILSGKYARYLER